MGDSNNEGKKNIRLTDRDVRIIYLPPATVASIHCVGGKPELETDKLAREFIAEYDLANLKPDFRYYGFNHPNGTSESDHGYERWITIPDDLKINVPFEKKFFKGGLYAAYMIPMGAFDEWQLIIEWACNNDKYDCAIIDDGGECMHGLLEEHLNFINLYDLKLSSEEFDKILQLDLLVPIKEKPVE